jgi:hypothetical protein
LARVADIVRPQCSVGALVGKNGLTVLDAWCNQVAVGLKAA